jgi:pimeloyl-ACP methyl ester carboxylesterase
VKGSGFGIAYHLGIDPTLQPAAYHDLPFAASMEVHQAIIGSNAVAEGLDVAHTLPVARASKGQTSESKGARPTKLPLAMLAYRRVEQFVIVILFAAAFAGRLPRDRLTRMAALITFWLLVSATPLCAFADDAKTRSAHDTEVAKGTSADKFVTVGGVRLHYVDWGGQGRVVLFLAGFGNDAHVFDTFAPQFAANFHVVGLTRRGFGQSDKPEDGYDVATRVRDIVAFLDAIGADRVDVVGHSMAGDEMTVLASQHPERVGRLVYLDAAYDHSKAIDLMLEDPGTPPLFQRLILEARGSPKAADVDVPDMPPQKEWDTLVKTIRALRAYRIDYSRVTVPALAIYASPGHYFGIEEGTPDAKRRSMERWWKKRQRPCDLANIRQFKREAGRGEIIEVKGAPHYLFTGPTEALVAAQVDAFLRRD